MRRRATAMALASWWSSTTSQGPRSEISLVQKYRAPFAKRLPSILIYFLKNNLFVIRPCPHTSKDPRVRRQISALMGIECQVAVRYYSSVGDTLRGLSKKADPLTTLRRQRRAEVPDLGRLRLSIGERESGELFYVRR